MQSSSSASLNEKHISSLSGANNSESLKTTISSVSDLSCPPPFVPPILIKDDSEILCHNRGPETTSGSKWGPGRDRRQLSQEGYTALAICATFLAGIQGQVMGFAAITPTGEPIPVASAIFLLGLLADIFGAILSFLTARWFEMLTEDEAGFLQQRWDVESCRIRNSNNSPTSLSTVDGWIGLSLYAGPYVVAMGLGCLILGLLVYAWASQPLAVLVLACVVCTGCMAFVMPFALRHNRKNVLIRFCLKRLSG